MPLNPQRTLSILFAGGTEDSKNFRKVHLLDKEEKRALCGQTFNHQERVDTDETTRANYVGREACHKCLRKLEKQEAAEGT